MKSTSAPGREGEARSWKRNPLVARPAGCPWQNRANRLVRLSSRVWGTEKRGRPDVRGVEGHAKSSGLALTIESLPCCYPPLPLVLLSAFSAPLQEAGEERARGGGGVVQSEKGGRKGGRETFHFLFLGPTLKLTVASAL